MDFICVGIRIPKCGSTSLSRILKCAFSDRTIFHLPHTLSLEGELSCAQALRFRRSQTQSLFRHYRTFDIAKACARIDRWALDGDLILGGHIDFSFVRSCIPRPMKIITLFREPGARCRSEYDYCRAGYRGKSAISRFDSTIKHRMAARYSFDGYLDFLFDHASSYGNLAARYVGWDGEERLNQFFDRAVFHSGVLERSDVFARDLAVKMRMPLEFPHENPTGTPAIELNAVQRAKIERLYERDFMLYEWQLTELARPRLEVCPLTLSEPRRFDDLTSSFEAGRPLPALMSHDSRTAST